jgi:hypothetical protein
MPIARMLDSRQRWNVEPDGREENIGRPSTSADAS